MTITLRGNSPFALVVFLVVVSFQLFELMSKGSVDAAFATGSQRSPKAEEKKLKRNWEIRRCHLALAWVSVVLLEVCFGEVRSWGIVAAMVIASAAYIQHDNFEVSRIYGPRQLSPSQQSNNRRGAIIPATIALFAGTTFQGNYVHATILVASELMFLVLALVPEPNEY